MHIAPSGVSCCYAICDYRLICRDVVRGHVLNGDLLLSPASVVVEPFGQYHDRPCRLVGELEIFRPRLMPCHFSNPFRCYIVLPLNRGTGLHGERSER